MFYSTLLEGARIFRKVFELNTTENALLGFKIPNLEVDSGDRNLANGISCKTNQAFFQHSFGL